MSERQQMTPRELMYEEMIRGEILDLAKLLGISPVIGCAIVGRIMGEMNACIDESIKDNEEVRQRLIIPGAEMELGPCDTHDSFMTNYTYTRARHLEAHEKKRLNASKETHSLMERLLRKG